MAFKRDWVCKKCNYVVANVPTHVQEVECPKCEGQMEKVWDSPFVIFRGEGWTQKTYR